MAEFTIRSLIENNNEIAGYYQRALEIWNEILSLPEANTEDGLAGILYQRQGQFEHISGDSLRDRLLGQEIMVAVGIGQFYSLESGFGVDLERVEFIIRAFEGSYCSRDVAGRVATIRSIFNI
jgi:hypothetical protein